MNHCAHQFKLGFCVFLCYIMSCTWISKDVFTVMFSLLPFPLFLCTNSAKWLKYFLIHKSQANSKEYITCFRVYMNVSLYNFLHREKNINMFHWFVYKKTFHGAVRHNLQPTLWTSSQYIKSKWRSRVDNIYRYK